MKKRMRFTGHKITSLLNAAMPEDRQIKAMSSGVLLSFNCPEIHHGRGRKSQAIRPGRW